MQKCGNYTFQFFKGRGAIPPGILAHGVSRGVPWLCPVELPRPVVVSRCVPCCPVVGPVGFSCCPWCPVDVPVARGVAPSPSFLEDSACVLRFFRSVLGASEDVVGTIVRRRGECKNGAHGA
eukprot:gene12133-biopygen21454